MDREDSLFKRNGTMAALSALLMVAALARGTGATPNDEIIDPDQEGVSATSYYPTFGQIPSKMVDNSGLSSPLPTGAPLPASDAAYPAHDTVLTDMYRSGKDTHPDLFFSVGGVYSIDALHYWNFNADNTASHPTGGDRERPDDGIQSLDIAVSTSNILGPYTTIGTYTLAEAPVSPDYTGATLALGRSVAAKYVRFHINTNFSALGPDQSGYFGMSELRFIGHSQPADTNLDGRVDFADLLTLAQHYGAQSGATLATGDVNGDAKVDFADLLFLAQNYGQSLTAAPAALTAVSSVPEARAIGIILVVAPVLLARRRGAADSQ